MSGIIFLLHGSREGREAAWVANTREGGMRNIGMHKGDLLIHLGAVREGGRGGQPGREGGRRRCFPRAPRAPAQPGRRFHLARSLTRALGFSSEAFHLFSLACEGKAAEVISSLGREVRRDPEAWLKKSKPLLEVSSGDPSG